MNVITLGTLAHVHVHFVTYLRAVLGVSVQCPHAILLRYTVTKAVPGMIKDDGRFPVCVRTHHATHLLHRECQGMRRPEHDAALDYGYVQAFGDQVARGEDLNRSVGESVYAPLAMIFRVIAADRS